jgi:UDP-GlcNAc:undecaprenyl-phosphate GlcNAc-1-phosphate transferase
VSTLGDFFTDTYGVFVAFALAVAITWALTPVAADIARRLGAVDEPAARKIHTVATPRMGGIAIYFGVIVPSLLFITADGAGRSILVGASLITLVGVLDDVRGTSPLLKLVLQFVVAAIPVFYGLRVETLSIPGVGILDMGWVGIPFSLLWVVAIMNIVNFIDGMDGLAAGICAISAVTFAVIAVSLGRVEIGILAAAVAGATGGFLVHNFYPASIFMGDSGSLLLGFLLGTISLQGFLKGVAAVALVIPLLVLSIPILDTGFAILRRVKNRRPIMTADRGHIHHRFANLGYSQRQTVVIIYSWSALMSVVALCMRFAPVWVTAVVAGIATVVSLLLVYELEILRWSKIRRWTGFEKPAATATVTGVEGRDGSPGERVPSGGERTEATRKTS